MIINFFLKICQYRKSTMEHFEDEGYNKWVLKRYTDFAKVVYSGKSRPQTFVLTDSQLKNIMNHYMHNRNNDESSRDFKFNISKPSGVIAKKKLWMKYRKRFLVQNMLKKKECAEKSLTTLYKLSVSSGSEVLYNGRWNLLSCRFISSTR